MSRAVGSGHLRRRVAVGLIASLLTLSACAQSHPAARTSGGSGVQEARGAEQIQAQLRKDVRAVASAVAGHHPNQARAALAALNADTAAAHAAGRLSSERLSRIRDAIATLTTDLSRLEHTPAPTVTVTTTNRTTTSPPRPDGGTQRGSDKEGSSGKPGDHTGKGPHGGDKDHDSGRQKGGKRH